MKEIEYHPLKPFLPLKTELLMLGSFPPKRERWSMDFFYPNYQNDMWRIFGLVFFNNKDYFVLKDKKSFDQPLIESFLQEKGIAIFDTAQSVIRHKDNASDNFLEVVEKTDVKAILRRIPDCKSIVTTGQKASDTLSEMFNCSIPKIGEYSSFEFEGRLIQFYRMPSTSRAYPLSIDKKSEKYSSMFSHLGII